jgi:hypothetical protein
MNGKGTKVVLTVYAPIATADAVRSALAATGAGRIGKYVGCSFSAHGVGRFLPLEGAHPAVGAVGEMAEVAEERIETVVDRELLPTVLRAAKAAHPYEEPVILVTPLLDVDALLAGDVPRASEQ